MTIFKITNVTNFIGKRDPKYNTKIDIEYVNNFLKNTISIKPGEFIFIKIKKLPISIHKLVIKKYVSIMEVSEEEMNKMLEIKTQKKQQFISEIIEDKVNILEEKEKKKTKKKSE